MSVCLFGCLNPINVKTAEPIRPKFCVGPHVAPGKVYDRSKFQKFVFKSFYFCKILKNAATIIMKSANFFLKYCTKRRCSQINQQLEVEIEDKSLVIYNSSELSKYVSSINEKRGIKLKNKIKYKIIMKYISLQQETSVVYHFGPFCC